uniref:Uncharacterized protein n=1 Tax=Rhizophora mucronata TaxID=61149 RepID=A0A2P2PYW5_RHIMU
MGYVVKFSNCFNSLMVMRICYIVDSLSFSLSSPLPPHTHWQAHVCVYNFPIIL